MALGVLGTPLTAAINAVYQTLMPVAQESLNLIVKLFYR